MAHINRFGFVIITVDRYLYIASPTTVSMKLLCFFLRAAYGRYTIEEDTIWNDYRYNGSINITNGRPNKQKY